MKAGRGGGRGMKTNVPGVHLWCTQLTMGHNSCVRQTSAIFWVSGGITTCLLAAGGCHGLNATCTLSSHLHSSLKWHELRHPDLVRPVVEDGPHGGGLVICPPNHLPGVGVHPLQE